MTWSPAADRLSRGTFLVFPFFAVFNRQMTRESRVDHESSQRIRMESPNRRVAAPPQSHQAESFVGRHTQEQHRLTPISVRRCSRASTLFSNSRVRILPST